MVQEERKENEIKDKKDYKDIISDKFTSKRSEESPQSKSKDKYYSKYNSHSKKRNYNEGNEKNKK